MYRLIAFEFFIKALLTGEAIFVAWVVFNFVCEIIAYFLAGLVIDIFENIENRP